MNEKNLKKLDKLIDFIADAPVDFGRAEALENLWGILKRLPEGMPVPVFCDEQDGEPAVDWECEGASLSLNAKTDGTGEIGYSALIDGRAEHGRERADSGWGDALPDTIRRLLKTVARKAAEASR